MEKWNGLSMLQVNSYAGIKRDNRAGDMLRQHGASYKQVAGHVKRRSFLQTGASRAELPESWDWSDVGGRSFLEPVMDQSECGSCYVASAIRMLTARHKIKTNDTEAVPWLFGGRFADTAQVAKCTEKVLVTPDARHVGTQLSHHVTLECTYMLSATTHVGSSIRFIVVLWKSINTKLLS